jgi:hypothetical protein
MPHDRCLNATVGPAPNIEHMAADGTAAAIEARYARWSAE